MFINTIAVAPPWRSSLTLLTWVSAPDETLAIALNLASETSSAFARIVAGSWMSSV